MTACASLGMQADTGGTIPVTPVTLIDGILEPRLAVQSMHMAGPLDERRIRLHAPSAVAEPALAQRWLHRHAVVAIAHRLSDESLRWSVLGHGGLRRYERTVAEGVQQHRFVLHDQWTEAMARPAPTVWWANHESALRPLDHGTLVPGPEGNRSGEVFEIASRLVHVLQRGGKTWTIGDALAMLDAFANLRLSLDLLPRELHDAPLLTAVDLSQPVGEALRRVLEPYGLVVRRELWRNGHTMVEDRHVRAVQHGRPVRLRWGRHGRPLADALRIDHAAPADAAQRWIAAASGWRIASTFTLGRGWDPALEGADDSAYDRVQSDDFAQYANVYRHWVLNEDGRFSGPPYDHGEPFDLAAFFADSRVRPQPLMFMPCVTLDDTGAPRPAVVEVSTDNGTTWAQYSGRALIGEHRAAVYLDDDTLPSAFFNAAKTGVAKVRVTASLQNPRGVRRTRWRGNAFAGEREPRVLSVGGAFAFRRVAEGSIHHEAVRNGELAAREVDQSQALAAWLVDRMREAAQRSGASLEGRGRVHLAGAWPWLRLGDRLMEAGGSGRDAAGDTEAVTQRGVVVDALHVRFGVSAQAGPRTVVSVRF